MQKKRTYKGVPLVAWVIMFILMFITANAIGQAPIKLTKEDSIAADKFIDSLERKTSMLDFKLWCDKFAVGTQESFIILNQFYTQYMQTKYDAWLQQRKNKQKN